MGKTPASRPGWLRKAVIVTREAIEDHLRLEPVRAAAMSAEERRHFVIDNLAIVIAAANQKTDALDDAETVVIRSGDL